MDQRISLITLGVADLTRSRAFYAALGWREKYPACPGIAFFQCPGYVLGLYPLSDLLADQHSAAPPAPGGVTLAVNQRSREAVVRQYEEFIRAGGRGLKAPHDTPWGGFVAYAADPDGHPWEFTHVPAFPLDEQGALWLPENM